MIRKTKRNEYMKCDCGYLGIAEFGNFKDERRPVLPWPVHFRCPKCRTNKNIDYLESYDDAVLTILYPQICYGTEHQKHEPIEQRAYFVIGSSTYGWGFGTECPVCHWGHGGGFSKEYFDIVEKYIGKKRLQEYRQGASLSKNKRPKDNKYRTRWELYQELKEEFEPSDPHGRPQ